MFSFLRNLLFLLKISLFVEGLFVTNASGFLFSVTDSHITNSKFVKHLDDKNISTFIREQPSTLILFYAPWCHWCQRLFPKYEGAAELLHSQELPVTLAQIDASKYEDVAQEYNIVVFPTIRFFLDGKAHEYSGGRSQQEIVNWVTSHLQTELTLADERQLDAFLRNHRKEPALIALLSDPIGVNSNARNVFVSVSRQQDGVGFAEITNRDLINILIQQYKAPNAIREMTEFIIMMNPHAFRYPATEEPVILYNGSLEDAEGLQNFTKTYLFPVLADFDSEIASRVFTDGRPIFVLMTATHHEEQQDDDGLIEISRRIAGEYRNRIIFIHSRSDSIYDKRLQNALSIESHEIPTIRIVEQNHSGGSSNWFSTFKYKPTDEVLKTLDYNRLVHFVEEFLAGHLRPFVKSEPIPEPIDNNGPVYTLVAAEFDSAVLESPQDIVINFYAPWCGHCRKLEPIYRDIGTVLQPFNENIRVMRMDATQNELNLRIVGFPTIVLFKAVLNSSKKIPIYYNGERTKEALLEWILREGSKKINMGDVIKSELKLHRKNASRQVMWMGEEL